MDLHATEKLIERLELDLKESADKRFEVLDTPSDRNVDGDLDDGDDGGCLFRNSNTVELRPDTLRSRIAVLREYVDALNECVEKRRRETEEILSLLETVKKERSNFVAGGKRNEPEPAANGAAAESVDPKKAKPAAPVAATAVVHQKK